MDMLPCELGHCRIDKDKQCAFSWYGFLGFGVGSVAASRKGQLGSATPARDAYNMSFSAVVHLFRGCAINKQHITLTDESVEGRDCLFALCAM